MPTVTGLKYWFGDAKAYKLAQDRLPIQPPRGAQRSTSPVARVAGMTDSQSTCSPYIQLRAETESPAWRPVSVPSERRLLPFRC